MMKKVGIFDPLACLTHSLIMHVISKDLLIFLYILNILWLLIKKLIKDIILSKLLHLITNP
jgi:hypothetical protein